MEYLPGGESLVGDAAEISAGTGALLELLAPAFPNITWTPTEYIPPQRVTSTDTQWARWGKIGRGAQDLTTIDAHLSHFPNCERALAFDLRSDPWPAPLRSLDLIICANLLHITPWICAERLFDGASRALRPGGQFILYGAFTVDGEFIGDSNKAFDKFCRSTRGFGLKELRDLERLAADVGLACTTPRAMPANNLLLRFVKAERGPLQKMLSWAGVEELVL